MPYSAVPGALCQKELILTEKRTKLTLGIMPTQSFPSHRRNELLEAIKLNDHTRETIEKWIYGILVALWTIYAFLGGVLKQKFFGKLPQEIRLEIGLLVITVLLYTILLKIVAITRRRRDLQVCDDFLSGVRAAFENIKGAPIDIFALSTQSFLHHIMHDSNISLGRVRLLLPTDEAITHFYATNAQLLNLSSEKAVAFIQNQIIESLSIWNGLKSAGRVRELEYRRIEVFPTFYLAMVGDHTALYGNYYLDGLKTHHGLSLAESNIYRGRSSPAGQFKMWFESYWLLGNEII